MPAPIQSLALGARIQVNVLVAKHSLHANGGFWRVQTSAAAEPTNGHWFALPAISLYAFDEVAYSQDDKGEHHQPKGKA
jgi:hypothetical protein